MSATPLDALKYDCMPAAARSAELDRSIDEGDAGAPRRRAPKGPAAPRARSAGKDGRDTAGGCRERAADDLLKSVSMLIVNERRRMELSAASWTARAELLDRIEAGFHARRAPGAVPADDESAALRI